MVGELPAKYHTASGWEKPRLVANKTTLELLFLDYDSILHVLRRIIKVFFFAIKVLIPMIETFVI